MGELEKCVTDFEDMDEWEQAENEQQQDQIHYFWMKTSTR